MDKQTVLEETEKALDVIEDRLDEIEQIEEVVAKNKLASTLLIGGGVLLVAVSSAYAGYKFAERRLTLKYEALASEERENTKEYYSRMYKTGDYATPESTVRTLHPSEEIVEDEVLIATVKEAQAVAEAYVPKKAHVAYDKIGEAKLTVKHEERIEVVENVFTDAEEDSWNEDEELAQRTHDAPYIITEEEYLANDPEHEQSSLTYFEKDGVLCDSGDKIIDDIDKVVGDDNIVRFGHGSKNPNILFIRNEDMEEDFEIERSTGSYIETALGIKDSDEDERVRRTRQRGDDG